MKQKKKRNERSRLVTTYYFSFLGLIVVPLLLVLLVALSVMRSLMLDAAFEKIRLAQENVTSALETDINAATLKLSQILNADDGAALDLAAKIVSTGGQEKHAAIEQLKTLYSFAVAPSSDIIALHFYGKNGEVQYIKDALTVPLAELRRNSFYQKALQKPDSTSVSGIPSNITYKDRATAKTRMALVVAFAPQKTEYSGAIEMACLYVNTKVNAAIHDYSKERGQGSMCLVDAEGKVLIAPAVGNLDYTVPSELRTASDGEYVIKADGKTLRYIVAQVPGMDWRVVSAVDNDVLLGEFNRVALWILATSLALFALFTGFSIIFLRNIITPVNRLISGMASVETGDLSAHLAPCGQKEMRVLMHSFNSMVRQTKVLIQKNDEQQQEKHKAEMQALQSQINPHFLVNTLGSIRFIAMAAKFDSIKNMAEALMKILSGSFRYSAKLYTLEEEIDMLESYVYLMGIRYSGNFEVEYQIAEDCKQCQIPRLTLQPIVENAIVHGFEEKEEMGHIVIRAARSGADMQIVVADDGQGMADAQIEALFNVKADSDDKRSIGVANVHRRLQLNFGAQYGLIVKSVAEQGTSVILTMPACAPPVQEDKGKSNEGENRNV